METQQKIVLTDQEQQAFAVLRKIANQHGLELRACGGWVRDKILGKGSNDIDIAIDQMTGAAFARLVMDQTGEIGYVVAANPEQSKHLETAMVRVCGLDIDFANLRDESFGGAYDDSRILTENRFGTPEVDAQRRDLTINALFYNLNSGEVEDYVGGLEDLENMILRTPLRPMQTFQDDPLRMLRTFRFFSRFDRVKIDFNTLFAMGEQSVLEAFRNKVSAERIGAELIGKHNADGVFKPGILGLPRAPFAIASMEACGLLDIILDVPAMAGFDSFRMDQRTPHHVFDVFTHTMKLMETMNSLYQFHMRDPHRQALLMMAALLHDVGKRDPNCQQQREDGHFSYRKHEESSANVARQVMNRLRRGHEETDYVVQVVAEHMRPHSGLDSDKALRKFRHECPDTWEDIIFHAQCDCLASGVARTEAEIAKYEECVRRGRDQIVQEANAPKTDKPLLNGLRVMELIPDLAPKCGFIKEVNARLLELRLENPDLTIEDYEQAVLEMKPELMSKHSGK